MTLGGPCLGMAVDVFDDDGRPVRGRGRRAGLHGAVAGHDAGLYKDPQRYLDTYWSRWPDVWVHGDWASIDEDGDWFLHGRSDDTIKVAGKRLGPGRGRVGARVATPPWSRPRRSASPTRSRARRCGASSCSATGVDPTEELRAELVGARRRRAREELRPVGGAVHDRAAEDPQRQGPAPRGPGRRDRRATPATCRSLEDPSTHRRRRARRA